MTQHIVAWLFVVAVGIGVVAVVIVAVLDARRNRKP
jgi:hypothetical protein